MYLSIVPDASLLLLLDELAAHVAVAFHVLPGLPVNERPK
jgi:hypothetical protein